MAAESAWRLGVFLATLTAMAVAEGVAPRRTRRHDRLRRWRVNLQLTLINTALVRVVAPAGVVGLATYGQARGWGLLPSLPGAPWMAGVLAFVLLDAAVYAQHRVMHRVPVLWRLHRVHHTDEDLDVTSAVRFHPAEMLVSLGLKALVVVAMGATPVAVMVFEIVLNAAALVNHANWRLPLRADRVLRLVLVTPDMHRVHHSTRHDEQQANFGFNLPWWDHLCRTYRAQPAGGHEAMRIGLSDMPDPGTLTGALRAPFR